MSGQTDWQEMEHPVNISILKPFYLRAWFLLLLFGILLAVIIGLMKIRTYRLLKRQKELEFIIEQRTDKIVKQAEELKALDKVKSRFFANISHELRTPLTLILGPLSNIITDFGKLDSESLQAQLKMIERNGKSLLVLVEEILDLSKLESKQLQLTEELTPVQSYFEHLFEPFLQNFEIWGIKSHLEFDIVNSGVEALLDRKKIEKIFNNFLSNTLKFTSSGGSVNVLVKVLFDKITVKVTDTGKGIHPDDLPHIFKRYYQSRQANQKLQGGTGIGLALVKEYTTLMKGKVYAESTLGQGSTFVFEIPLKTKDKKPQYFVTDLEKSDDYLIDAIGYDFNLLVVEDNPDLRLFIQQILSKRYTNVYTASNGVEGLQFLEEKGEQVDLVISDVMMPEMDGLLMTKLMKSKDHIAKTPVMMLTALATEIDKLNALTIGVDDYLCKPFSTSELLVRVQNLLYNSVERKAAQQLYIEESTDTLLSSEEIEPEIEEQVPVHSENNKEAKTLSVEKLYEVERVKGLKEKEFLEELLQHIKASLEEGGITAEMLAGKVFLSQRQLTRKLKVITGLTPGKLIKEVQLQEARRLLEEGSFINIQEVAFSIGYSNPAYFSTAFKKRFGKSPTDYVNQSEIVV